jgi:hypothetical protein
VIRQAISCDICGNEKKQTNHWFVAYERGGELRVSGWGSRNRLRPGTKHLCGQTCLHKLVDDYMARAIGQKAQNAPQAEVEASTTRTDASLTSRGAYNLHATNDEVEFESSARLITATSPILPIPSTRPAPELVAGAGKQRSDCVIPLPEEPRYGSRNLRAEAWERERERELHGQDCRTDLTRRRANVRLERINLRAASAAQLHPESEPSVPAPFRVLIRPLLRPRHSSFFCSLSQKLCRRHPRSAAWLHHV